MTINTPRFLLFFSSLFFITACADRNMADLEDYVNEIKQTHAQPQGKVPDFPFLEPEDYLGFEHSDPFKSFETEQKLKKPQEIAEENADPRCIPPDLHRNREELEKYPLDALAMVGVLQKKANLWALVEAPDKIIHRVAVNNYIGQNFGRVIQVDGAGGKILIMEMHDDGSGCYREQEAVLAMPQENL